MRPFAGPTTYALLRESSLLTFLQMAVSDSQQYAAMLDGVDEIVTMVARYHEIETLYRSRIETGLKQEFEKRLVSLYKHIVYYCIAAAGYYQRSTMGVSLYLQELYVVVNTPYSARAAFVPSARRCVSHPSSYSDK